MSRRTAPPTRRSPATCWSSSVTRLSAPNGDGEVHGPRRGPRLPRPLRRAVAIAKQATGVRDPGEPRTPAPFLVGAARSGTTCSARCSTPTPT